MIDYSLVKLMHRHDDGWAALEPVDEDDAGGHHAVASHDPERSPSAMRDWVRRFRCRECGEEFAMSGDDPGATTGR